MVTRWPSTKISKRNWIRQKTWLPWGMAYCGNRNFEDLLVSFQNNLVWIVIGWPTKIAKINLNHEKTWPPVSLCSSSKISKRNLIRQKTWLPWGMAYCGNRNFEDLLVSIQNNLVWIVIGWPTRIAKINLNHEKTWPPVSLCSCRKTLKISPSDTSGQNWK